MKVISSHSQVIVASFLLIAQPASADAPSVESHILWEDFESLRQDLWCPCQISLSGPSKLGFGKENGTTFAHIPVLPTDIGGNKCIRAEECKLPLAIVDTLSVFANVPELDEAELEEPEPPESLGPSVVIDPERPSVGQDDIHIQTPHGGAETDGPAAEKPYPDGGPYCTPRLREIGKAKGEDVDTPCAQRQELRLTNDKVHSFDDALLYSIRFRMEQNVPDEKESVRWVTGQWKQEPAAQPGRETNDKDWGPSPFVAQRFDNGILHVTVQDKECRCLVASAPFHGSPGWTETPKVCYSTTKGAKDRETCPADLKAEYGDNRFLTNSRGQWVTLKYLIKPGRNGTGIVKVFDGDRLVVTVRGSIGYDAPKGEKSFVKFWAIQRLPP